MSRSQRIDDVLYDMGLEVTQYSAEYIMGLTSANPCQDYVAELDYAIEHAHDCEFEALIGIIRTGNFLAVRDFLLSLLPLVC